MIFYARVEISNECNKIFIQIYARTLVHVMLNTRVFLIFFTQLFIIGRLRDKNFAIFLRYTMKKKNKIIFSSETLAVYTWFQLSCKMAKITKRTLPEKTHVCSLRKRVVQRKRFLRERGKTGTDFPAGVALHLSDSTPQGDLKDNSEAA